MSSSGGWKIAVMPLCSEAQLALWHKEFRVVRLTSAIDERSALADLLRTEIAALRGQVQTLQEQLTQAGERARGLEGRHCAAMREAELALSQRETELSRLTGACRRPLSAGGLAEGRDCDADKAGKHTAGPAHRGRIAGHGG